jgi:hypothetical protein
LIEQYVKDSDTAAEFLGNFACTYGAVRTSDFSSAKGFGKIKARIERGEGPGNDVVMENVGVGARLIEQYIKESDTAAEFLAHFRAINGAVGSSDFSSANGFGMIKARIERGEGPGGDMKLTREQVAADAGLSRVHMPYVASSARLTMSAAVSAVMFLRRQ